MRQDIRFLLNGQPQRVSHAAGDLTLLGWLREQPHLRGTKQGCGEGDCGACTVALGRLDQSGQLVGPQSTPAFCFCRWLMGPQSAQLTG